MQKLIAGSKRRRAEVASLLRVRRLRETRRRVEGEVMVEELAQERHAGRLRVRIVGAQGQVDDQLLRPCRQRIVRIEQPTRLAELDQRSVDPSARDLAQVSVVSSEEHVTGEEYAEAPSPDKGGR